MRIAQLLVGLLLAAAAAMPASAAARSPWYSHSMQNAGTSELGMPPFHDSYRGAYGCENSPFDSCGTRYGR